jgi:hypothetical protein
MTPIFVRVDHEEEKVLARAFELLHLHARACFPPPFLSPNLHPFVCYATATPIHTPHTPIQPPAHMRSAYGHTHVQAHKHAHTRARAHTHTHTHTHTPSTCTRTLTHTRSWLSIWDPRGATTLNFAAITVGEVGCDPQVCKASFTITGGNQLVGQLAGSHTHTQALLSATTKTRAHTAATGTATKSPVCGLVILRRARPQRAPWPGHLR